MLDERTMLLSRLVNILEKFKIENFGIVSFSVITRRVLLILFRKPLGVKVTRMSIT